ncbi:MAG: hypothetical protein L6V85_09530 [Clostridiales bacterium]|nr:MAG: hypothetical protein L6V85_09530 [Clostridiales bacterium]
MHFGEGQPLSKKHIPEIALVTAPDYLCSVDPTGNEHMDKFNLDLMYEQIQTFINCVNLIDGKNQKKKSANHKECRSVSEGLNNKNTTKIPRSCFGDFLCHFSLNFSLIRCRPFRDL